MKVFKQFKLNIQQANQEIDRLSLERISLAGIARVTGVSKRWLQNYVNHKYAQVPIHILVTDKPKGRLTIECDEIWSFS